MFSSTRNRISCLQTVRNRAKMFSEHVCIAP